MVRIVIASDDPVLRNSMASLMETRGLGRPVPLGLLAAVDSLQGSSPDLVLLDLTGNRERSLQVCRRVRDLASAPIIALVPVEWESAVLAAIRNGADDFITKPFTQRELVARIERQLEYGERSDASVVSGERMERDGLVIDPSRYEVTSLGRLVRLSAREFKLLYYLMANEGRVCTAEAILDRVWRWPDDRSRDAVKVAMSRLRRKVEPDPAHPRWLHTVPGVGYTFRPQTAGRHPDPACRSAVACVP